jgi:hypothetical protein
MPSVAVAQIRIAADTLQTRSKRALRTVVSVTLPLTINDFLDETRKVN